MRKSRTYTQLFVGGKIGGPEAFDTILCRCLPLSHSATSTYNLWCLNAAMKRFTFNKNGNEKCLIQSIRIHLFSLFPYSELLSFHESMLQEYYCARAL